MKKETVHFSIPHYLLVVPCIIILTMLTASCQFPGFGEKPPCDESVLKIGERSYRIKEIKTKSDGSLNVPSNSPDTAYWVDQTNINYVFALSPTEGNLALQNSLGENAQATITWENCNSVTFNLSTPQAGAPDNATLLNQDISGITIFIQPASANTGLVIKGELAEETISEFNTPDASEAQAEISLLETAASEDGNTITVSVSILNYGQTAFTLSMTDVSLVAENGELLQPVGAEPVLPYEIKPGETVTMKFTFPHPLTATATLKILSVEYELEGY